MEHGRAADRGRPGALRRGLRRDVPFRRAHGAGHGRAQRTPPRATQHPHHPAGNRRDGRPGVGRAGGLRARPHRRAGDGRHGRAAAEGQAAQFSIAETKATKVDLGRTIAAMSSDKWFPGAPSGRIHVETAKRHGFRRRAVQALRHLAGRRQLPDDPGQGQGEPHAHAGRGLRAGAAVARPRRPVVAHGPAVDGHQGRGPISTAMARRTRARAS